MASEPRDPQQNRRRRPRVNWGLLLLLLALTWIGMCYGIYAVISSGKL